MSDTNKTIDEIAFAIIAEAGDGRAKVQEALKEARRGNFGQADEALKDAEAHLMKAHEIQTESLLKPEAEGKPVEGKFNTLVAHAQDYVMTGMVMRELAVELVELHAKVRASR